MSLSGNKQGRYLASALALAGIGAVAYGMIMQADEVFLGGIVCTIAAYALIRRRLRHSAGPSEKAGEDAGG